MKMKKILAVVLTSSMLFSLPVYAEETTVEVIQSESAEAETVEVETEAQVIESEVLETQVIETEQQIVMEENQTENELTDIGVDISGAVGSVYQDALNQSKENGIQAFVTRLYTKVLNRKPDKNGLNDWVSQLKNRTKSGAEVAQGFICSQELAKRNLSNSAYVEMLYQTFFDRASDKSGKSYWVKQLETGMSRNYVFRGFANSAEFQKICDKYSITRGTIVLSDPCDQNEGVTKFVYRCYKKFLGRTADYAGLNDWCNRLLTRKINAKEAAYGFVMSAEFQNQGLDDDGYVETMYQGLFDRASDVGGYCSWMEKLASYYTREYVFYGFADSQEFRNLAASFGLANNWKGTNSKITLEMPQITLDLPASWDGHFVCETSGNPYNDSVRYTFRNKENYEAYYGGHLFTIVIDWAKEPIYYPSYEILLETNGATYYVVYPTDVQFDYEDPQLTSIYNSMNRNVPGIINSVRFWQKGENQ